MATGRLVMDVPIPRDTFKCGVCLVDFTDPRNLSCGHVFCLTCIEPLRTQENFIKCPMCRKETAMETDSVADLGAPTILKDLQLRASESNKLCEVCQSKGDFYCENCKSFLCDPCSKQHTRLNKMHVCLHVNDFKICDVHARQAVTRYCLPCKQFICNLCVHNVHAGHEAEDIKEVYKEVMNKFESLQKLHAKEPVLEKLEDVLKMLSFPRFTNITKELSEQFKNFREDFSDIKKQYHRKLDSRKQCLKGQIKRLKHNDDILERGLTIRGSTKSQGMQIQDMKSLIAEFKPDQCVDLDGRQTKKRTSLDILTTNVSDTYITLLELKSLCTLTAENSKDSLLSDPESSKSSDSDTDSSSSDKGPPIKRPKPPA